MLNELHTVKPYKNEGVWVFDDDSKGLRKEPIINKQDVMLDKLVIGINDAEQGFCLLFSDTVFCGYQVRLIWQCVDDLGHWYTAKGLCEDAWFYPGFLQYFRTLPGEIFIRCCP